VSHDSRRPRDPTPLPNLSDGSYSGRNNGLTAVVFRITMVALTEEERVRGAVGDVLNANAAVNPEDAVPRYTGRIRWSARRHRARAGVAAITAHPIETPRPRGGDRCRVLHHVCRQRIRRTEQQLDDMSLGGIPAPGDIVAVIVVVPLLVQVVLSDVGEQLDPQVGALGRNHTQVDG